MVSNYSQYIEAIKHKVDEKLDNTQLYQFKGTVSKLLGLTVEVKLPGLKIGDLCYIETYNGEKINSLMITHIPVWEIFNIVHNRKECKTVGEHPENYGLGTFNSGLFAAVLQRKDVRAMCGGHSHLNDASGVYCGVILSTDGSIGYSAYGDNERRGARVFEINENDPATVKTRMIYCRDL